MKIYQISISDFIMFINYLYSTMESLGGGKQILKDTYKDSSMPSDVKKRRNVGL